MSIILPAIILNEPYADWVKTGKKTIETRMRAFRHRGDIVICCDKGKSKSSKNSGKALCIVDIYEVRDMLDSDADAACIGNVIGRKAYLLRDWRHFNFDFQFTQYAITKNWQGVFQLRIPDFVAIIPRPDIVPFKTLNKSHE